MRTKNLIFRSWERFVSFYIRMKEDFPKLRISFLKRISKKFQATSYLIVVNY